MSYLLAEPPGELQGAKLSLEIFNLISTVRLSLLKRFNPYSEYRTQARHEWWKVPSCCCWKCGDSFLWFCRKFLMSFLRFWRQLLQNFLRLGGDFFMQFLYFWSQSLISFYEFRTQFLVKFFRFGWRFLLRFSLIFETSTVLFSSVLMAVSDKFLPSLRDVSLCYSPICRNLGYTFLSYGAN